MTTSTIQHAATPLTRRATRALVAAAAALAAVLVWVIAVPALGLSVTIPESPGSLNRVDLRFVPVLVTAVVVVLAGWGLLALFERITRRARPLWTVAAVAVFLLTLPYLPGFTVTERVVITLIHVALAVVLITGLRRTSAARP